MSAIKVMIVDDEPRIRRGVERLVASCGGGWEVVAALGDGAEALEYMRNHDGGVDLLITDIKMPEMDGLALIKEGRKSYGFSPLLLTGYDDFEYMQTALREGAIDYLLKPIDREQFRERLAALKERIERERLSRQRWAELNRKAGQLEEMRRKQALAYITSSAGEDLSHLGFWTDDFPRGFYALLYVGLDVMPVKTRAYTEKDWQAFYYALDNIIDEIVSGPSARTPMTGAEAGTGGRRAVSSEEDTARPGNGGGSGGQRPAGEERGAFGEAEDEGLSEPGEGYAFWDAVMPPAGSRGWSWRGRASDFWVLLYCPANTGGDALDGYAEAAADAIRAAVRAYTPFTVSVAYGDWLEDLYLLPGAKREAQSLIHYRLLQGGNRNFTPKSAAAQKNGASSGKPEAETKLPEQLKQAIGQGRPDEAASLVRSLLETLERMGSPAEIQSVVQNAIVLLHSVGIESCGQACFSVEEALEAAKRAVRLQDLRAVLEGLIEASLRQIEAKREKNSMLPVEQAKAFIEEHLAGDITIRRIAEHVYMNPNYFCQYFKLQTGETVLDYVTRRRMELAAKLLGDPGIKLQELSERVGYQNPKYFARLFKAWSGVTPSKFRERLLQGE